MNPGRLSILLRRLALAVTLSTLASGVEPNQLTPEEQRNGWILLFNGHDLTGWRSFGKPEAPKAGWSAENGWLHHAAKGGGGDLITTQTFTNFDLVFDWRIAPGGNSGLKYFIDERRGAPIGHEYQLIDDAAHPDAKVGPKRQTAALYDALPPVGAPVRPAGETNTSRIRIRGPEVEHWLNGVRVLGYTVGSPELAAAKAASKFKDEAKWGTVFATPLLLQDHGDAVWFQNLKLRVLGP
ncbi:MAG TPA: DUF1080 domain-containing protein [Verrucomicrobiota bacterium]|nr:DUF1080 domain-containing protein [Verrucomicrobiales bacterium]HRI15778.1 DUF1080 domain-containing protein [Verrucomicrobiota bacterium]